MNRPTLLPRPHLHAVLACIFSVLAACLCPLLSATSAQAAEVHPGMLRFPDVSATQVVFVYDNDVWIAPREGGQAFPLSSPPGMESFPRFSPDGSHVAFSASYDGNGDVYELPVSGGQPVRLTVQPYGARTLDYAPDGRVVYCTGDVATTEQQLWYAARDGGLPERLPLKYGDMVSFAADGKWLAFCPWRHYWQDDSWDRYQGGQAADVWTFDLASHESRRLTDWPGTDDIPMVSGRKVYFLSDAGPEHRRNIWVYDLDTSQRTQVTSFSDGEVRYPAIGPRDIVFQQAGKLWRLPLDTLKAVELQIRLAGDLPHVQRFTSQEGGMPQALSLGPQGHRLAAESHGDIWSLPVKQGTQSNLTPTDGVAERDPHWSPDGRWIAYVSDSSGMYEIWLLPTDGKGEARQLTHDSSCRMFGLQWSPDSHWLLCIDRSSTYFVVNAESGEKKVLATDHFGAINAWTGWASLGASWSPDSRWVALVLSDEKSRNGVVHIVGLEDGVLHPVTSPLVASREPVFDRAGDLLYFLTDQSYSPLFADQEDYDANYVMANSSRLACLPLRHDVPSPLLPHNDEEPLPAMDEKAKDEKPAEDAPPAGPPAPAPVNIDFDGIVGRIQSLPVEAGNLGSLSAGPPHQLLFLRWPRTGAQWGSPDLHVLDVSLLQNGQAWQPGPDGQAQQPDKVLQGGIDGYVPTPDASQLLIYAHGAAYVVPAAPGVPLDKPVPLPERIKSIDPQHEWRQIIWEDWRTFKEKFYDPNLHGVDWDAARDRALAMLPYCACREDFGFIISELNAELNVGHTYVWSGSSGWGGGYGIGLLGCDFERGVDSAGHPGIRFARIYHAADGELDTASPLLAPGVDVHEGQFLLAVNGTKVSADTNPWGLMLGRANQTVELTVGDTASSDSSSRKVLLNAMGWDGELRHRAWVEDKRAYVQAHSGGRLGYIHVRNTSGEGRVDLQRQINSQCNYDAVIVDERYNGGGSLPLRFIDLLRPPAPVYVKTHYGAPGRAPSRRVMAPLVMLVNQYSGSCGDLFPYLFRQAGLGPLIGVRTWGGLVGLSGGESFLDGSGCVVPSLGVYGLDGQWIAEGHGIDPDIEVVNDPSSVAAGLDPQLDRAIAEALKRADEEPFHETPAPAYVDHSGVREER